MPIAARRARAPQKVPQKPADAPAPATEKGGLVAILQGCAEPVLRPEFREATVRLLNRCGIDVTFAKGEVCCGALVHHLGREEASLDAARRNVEAWTREMNGEGLDAIVIQT